MDIPEINKIKKRKKFTESIIGAFCFVSGTAEIFLVLLIWWFIFYSSAKLRNSQDEIITYLILGNFINLLAGYFLHRIVMRDVVRNQSREFLSRPVKYFAGVVGRGMARFFLPLLGAAIAQVALLVYLVGDVRITLGAWQVSLTILMIFLAFILEFLMFIILRQFFLWTIENHDYYTVTLRLKKLLAGSYFPLDILPFSVFNFSLFLPFAYSFYVPTQLFTGQLTKARAISGVFVQIIWIMIFYAVIKINYLLKEKKKQEAATADK